MSDRILPLLAEFCACFALLGYGAHHGGWLGGLAVLLALLLCWAWATRWGTR